MSQTCDRVYVDNLIKILRDSKIGVHLGTTIYTQLYRDNVIDVVNELYKRTNYLLADFSFTESYTASNLSNSYCKNLYSC